MSIMRQRTKNLIITGLAGAVFSGVIGAGVVVYNQTQYMKQKNRIIAEYEKKEKEPRIIVYVTQKDIAAGSKYTKELFKPVEVFKSMVSEDAISSLDEIINKIAKVAIKPNTVITESLVFEKDKLSMDLRNNEFTEIHLPQKLTTNDFIDVRINFPTGQDYIVMSKKKVKDLQVGKVWFEMNESEILTLSSAMVDAYLNGGKLYGLSYIEPGYQEKADVNYPVNDAVLELMKTNPDLLSTARQKLTAMMRKSLDERLEKLKEAGITPTPISPQGKDNTSNGSQTQNPSLNQTVPNNSNVAADPSGETKPTTNTTNPDNVESDANATSTEDIFNQNASFTP